MMEYGKGTVVLVKDTIYADNGKCDRKGHPGMIPIASDDISSETYYLMLTSNMARVLAYQEQYYDLSDVWEQIPLEKPSGINLEIIYKGHVFGDKLGGLCPQLYKDVIRKMKEYQNQHPCPYYEEIKNQI